MENLLRRKVDTYLKDWKNNPDRKLIAAIEDNFGLTIPNSDLQSFKTIDDIISYVENKKSV